MAYLDKQVNELEPIRAYLAQIAMEVRRSWVKNPRAIKSLDPFMIEFVEKKPPAPVPITDEEETEETEIDEARMNLSKAFWFALAGVTRDNKKGA